MKKNWFSLLLAALVGLLVLTACNPSNGGDDDPYAGRELTFNETLPDVEGLEYSDGYTLHALALPRAEATTVASTDVKADGSFALHLPKNPSDSVLVGAEDVFTCNDNAPVAGTPTGAIWQYELRDAEGTARYRFSPSSFDNEELRVGFLLYLTEPFDDVESCTNPNTESPVEIDLGSNIGWTAVGFTSVDDTETFAPIEDPVTFAGWEVKNLDESTDEGDDTTDEGTGDDTGDDTDDGDDGADAPEPLAPNPLTLSGEIDQADLDTSFQVGANLFEVAPAASLVNFTHVEGDVHEFSLDLETTFDSTAVASAAGFESLSCLDEFNGNIDDINIAQLQVIVYDSDDSPRGLLNRQHSDPDLTMINWIYADPASFPDNSVPYEFSKPATECQDEQDDPVEIDLSLQPGWNVLSITRLDDKTIVETTTQASASHIPWFISPY